MYYKVTRFAFVCLFCFSVLNVFMSGLWLVRLSLCSQMRVFPYFVSYCIVFDNDLFVCLAYASAFLLRRDMLRCFITISPNRKCKSTNLAVCNRQFVRYVVEINKPYTEDTSMRARLLESHHPRFMCLFMKESTLVNFFVLLQHLCYVCYGFEK